MTNEILSWHSFLYTNRDRVPIREIAESLLGMERVAVRLRPAFSALCPEAGLEGVRLDLESLQAGSLKDTLLLRLIFGSPEAAERWLDELRRRTGMTEINQRLPFAGPMLLGGLLVGAAFAAQRMIGRDASIPGTTTHIEINNSTVIAAGAERTGMSPQDFSDLLNKSIPNRFNLASNACRVIHPAKLSEGASIVVDGEAALTVSPDSVRETPAFVEKSSPDDVRTFYEKTPVEIRALDLDTHSKGWAVIIPVVGTSRIRLEIDPSVRTDALLRSGPVLADIDVFFKENPDGDLVPRRAYLRAIK